MLIEKITLKDKSFFSLQAEKKINEDNLNTRNIELQIKFEEKNQLCKEHEDKLDKTGKEIKELVSI
jgi:hypothetical protein